MNQRTLPKIGVSACLLGQQVRYDGGHKRNRFLVDELATHVEYVAICPEVAIGLGTPRPPIHLVGPPDHPRAVRVDNPAIDVTQQLEQFAESQIKHLRELSGFVLKRGSPSCGKEHVRVYSLASHQTVRKGSGVFARLLMQRLPLLPVVEAESLHDPLLRENFIKRIHVYQRWQQRGLSVATRSSGSARY